MDNAVSNTVLQSSYIKEQGFYRAGNKRVIRYTLDLLLRCIFGQYIGQWGRSLVICKMNTVFVKKLIVLEPVS